MNATTAAGVPDPAAVTSESIAAAAKPHTPRSTAHRTAACGNCGELPSSVAGLGAHVVECTDGTALERLQWAADLAGVLVAVGEAERVGTVVVLVAYGQAAGVALVTCERVVLEALARTEPAT